MEPQHNKLVAVRKAISAHEEAAATLMDLLNEGQNPQYETMMERIKQNLTELHMDSVVSDPTDKV